MYEWSSPAAKHAADNRAYASAGIPVINTTGKLVYKLERAKKTNVQKTAGIGKENNRPAFKGNTQPDFNGYLDTYFNSGCCCFDDGDITGIEIADGCIRLIKWSIPKKECKRIVLEECKLEGFKAGNDGGRIE
jgi:hypothetical protein